MMIATIAAAALLAPAYKSVLVASQKPDFWRGWIACTVLTEKETVAGYICPSTGHHGETDFSRPFVWSKGKLTKLPLLKNGEYGQVLAGNDGVLFGSVDVNYKTLPVQWTPDPKLGWSKAKVTRLGTAEGSAVRISPDGRIWIEREHRLVSSVRGGSWRSYSFGDFKLVGFDKIGKIYGNKFSAMHFGNRTASHVPGWFSGTRWNRLSQPWKHPENYDETEIVDVNLDGVSVGQSNRRLTIWNRTNYSHPLSKELRWSFATDINNKGAVLGECAVEDVESRAAFILSNNKGLNLNQYLPGFDMVSAERINDLGAAVLMVRKGEMEYLYLLRPIVAGTKN